MPRRKNTQAKRRPPNNPYEIWVREGRDYYEYRVLKKYQIDDDKPYARWYCATLGPGTFGTLELGDEYVTTIKRGTRKLTDQEMKKLLAKGA